MQQSVYEIFEYSHPLDILIYLHKVRNVAMHWHSAYEFLLILDGECSIATDETRTYRENDITLINAFEPHSIISKEGCVILALQVRDSVFGSDGGFNVDSVKNPGLDYKEIKTIMAQLIKLHGEKAPGYEILMQSLILRLKYEMVSEYRADADGAKKFDRYRSHISKLSGVLDYIKDNYRGEVSLTRAANDFFFSPAYLSRLFEKTMGITFKKYVDSLRFTDAMNLLLTTDKSIDDVAAESGFPNTRSFVSMHKDAYGCLPSEHRKNISASSDPSDGKSMHYIDFKKTDYLSKLAAYLDADVGTGFASGNAGVEHHSYTYDVTREIAKVRHNEKNFCCVGRAADILRENVREMLSETQKKIGFRYIKFHGLFDDDLSVYAVTSDGRVIVNYDNIDNILDFLLSIKLKPLLQLSFMPKALAKYPEKTTFYRPLVMSEPRSNGEWADFIGRFVRHLVSRYGYDEVSSWLFSVWNEAETPPDMFGFRNPSLFPEFYRATYRAVKEICPGARFGTTSVMYETLTMHDWFDKLYTMYPDCRPDFVNLHFYPVETSITYDIDHLSSNSIELSPDPYIMSKTITAVKSKLEKLGFGDLPVYLTEWNSTTSHRDLLNDTAFKGAYVVRNVIDNLDRLDSFGYWSLTDDIYELPADDKLFHGGHGMFTKNGIKKPPFYAFEFLSRLGENLLGHDKGVAVTSDAGGYQMVLVNYIHYNELYAAGELFDTNPENRYAAFRSEHEREVCITLKNVEKGTYFVEEYIVNRHDGSAYDIWRERFHNEEPFTSNAMEALRRATFPKYCMSKTEADENGLVFRARLEPHEIRLVMIKRI